MRLNVLFGCEESQEGCKAFRELGHEAYSCDLIECSGGHPEWHLQMDIFEAMKLKKWDLIMTHPPCTHLAVSGARHFEAKQADGRQDHAIGFFLRLFNEACKYAEFVGQENPVSIMSSLWRKPDQIIQPWQFGHGETKATCLWLKNLPLLVPTNIVEGREQRIWKMPPGPDRARERSRTFPGIAMAMAEQWSNHIVQSRTVNPFKKQTVFTHQQGKLF